TIAMQNVLYNLDAAVISCRLMDGRLRTGNLELTIQKPFASDSARVIVRLVHFTDNGWTFDCDSLVMLRLGTGGRHVSFRADVFGGRCFFKGYTLSFESERIVSVYPQGNSSLSSPF